jgi:hypothetical protein
MSTVIIVDSACELPERIANSGSIKILPLSLMLDSQSVRDDFSGEQTLQFIGMNNDLGLSAREKGHDKAITRINLLLDSGDISSNGT